MTAVVVSACPPIIIQFLDNAGRLNAGGTVLTQVGGINHATYQDSGGTTALPNPIPLNSRGEISNAAGASCQLFLESGVTYTFTIYDANGNQLDQATSVTGVGSGSGVSSSPSVWCGTAGGSANAITLSAVVPPNPTSYAAGQRFMFVAANNSSSTVTIAVGSLGALAAQQGAGSAFGTGGGILTGYTYEAVVNGAANAFIVSSINVGVGRAGDTMTGALTMSGAAVNTTQGADIASAGTINLDTMTGNEGQLTGTSTVTVVTLTNGRTRRLRLTGAVLITAGASLVVQGTQSGSTYTGAVGEIWSFEAIQSVIYVTISRMVALAGLIAAGGNFTTPADTTEDTLTTVTIPAGAMGINGMLRITSVWTTAGSSNKTPRVRFSGGSGTVYSGTAIAGGTGGDTVITIIANQAATNSQAGGSLVGNAGTPLQATSAVDTTAATTVVFTGQKVAGADTLKLAHYTIELVPSA